MRGFLFGFASAAFLVSQLSPLDSPTYFVSVWSAIILTTIGLFIKVAR